MRSIVIEVISWLLTSEMAKVMLGRLVDKIVVSTKTTIDNEIADKVLTGIVVSKGNDITEAMMSDIRKALK